MHLWLGRPLAGDFRQGMTICMQIHCGQVVEKVAETAGPLIESQAGTGRFPQGLVVSKNGQEDQCDEQPKPSKIRRPVDSCVSLKEMGKRAKHIRCRGQGAATVQTCTGKLWKCVW